MGGPYYEKALELWLAPGNSEMDVVQTKWRWKKSRARHWEMDLM
jgi:hypothetical protein